MRLGLASMIPITGKAHDLGNGFRVTRLLPQSNVRSIGPFVFLDYFGPVDFAPGQGIDVRPHPHIGLATVTYLFEGAQTHRDSIGSVQDIRPGDVNWMTAGRGITHSERTPADARAHGHRMHGVQSWVALPREHEETAPDFQHIGANDLPQWQDKSVNMRLIAGEAFGLTSPVKTFSPLFYADAQFEAGGALHYDASHQERAFLVIDGDVHSQESQSHGAGTFLMLAPGQEITLYADAPARVLLLGGAPLDGPRHIWWNFVSSERDRIERAKQEWKSGAFGTIPGDDQEFIPLPEPR